MTKTISIGLLLVNVLMAMWLFFIPVGVIVSLAEFSCWFYLKRISASNNDKRLQLERLNLLIQIIFFVLTLIMLYILITSNLNHQKKFIQ